MENTSVPIKLGGSILTSPAAYRAAATFLKKRAADAPLVVVVSAEDGHTDELLREAAAAAGSAGAASDAESRDRDARDLLCSTGELRSVALLTIALRAAGVSAIGLNVHETGLRAGAAALDLNPLALRAALTHHAVVVVPGFLATRHQQVTTLGRGGSDWSAVLLAQGLGARSCELIKDVDGYFTSDPHTNTNAQLIARLSYTDAIRMADDGCPLVQRQALVAARDAGVELVIRSLNSQGTIVGRN